MEIRGQMGGCLRLDSTHGLAFILEDPVVYAGGKETRFGSMMKFRYSGCHVFIPDIVDVGVKELARKIVQIGWRSALGLIPVYYRDFAGRFRCNSAP